MAWVQNKDDGSGAMIEVNVTLCAMAVSQFMSDHLRTYQGHDRRGAVQIAKKKGVGLLNV